MSTPETSITLATREDVPEILAMIKELADYEHEPSSVLATEESLTRTLTFAPSTQLTNPGYAQTLILRVPAPAVSSSTKTNPVSAAAPTTAAATTTTTTTTTTSTTTTRDHPEGLHAGTVVAGMALYFYNYSTWRAKPGVYLEDLFVRPAFRRKGYGRLLLQALAREVLRVDGGRLEWSCLKWNEPSLQFYRSLGAKEMVDWVGLRVDGVALEKLALGGGA